uniref:Uncharacterized protein n=1 Tax=Oryza rufipogon TaxID=4529 RepID=A0A0E0ND77_ORYRU
MPHPLHARLTPPVLYCRRRLNPPLPPPELTSSPAAAGAEVVPFRRRRGALHRCPRRIRGLPQPPPETWSSHPPRPAVAGVDVVPSRRRSRVVPSHHRNRGLPHPPQPQESLIHPTPAPTATLCSPPQPCRAHICRRQQVTVVDAAVFLVVFTVS